MNVYGHDRECMKSHSVTVKLSAQYVKYATVIAAHILTELHPMLNVGNIDEHR